jgi:glutaredoxin 3
VSIKVYSKANCPGCVTLKGRLTQAGIEFEEVRIDQDPEVAKWLIAQGHRQVPVVYKEGKHIANLKDLDNLL